MSLIEHWYCERCGGRDAPVVLYSAKPGCHDCEIKGERGWMVKLVPEQQLRGAVEALERIVVALAEQGYNGRDEALSIGRAALDRLDPPGGQ